MRPATTVQVATGVQNREARRRIIVLQRNLAFAATGNDQTDIGEQHRLVSNVVDFGHEHLGDLDVSFPLRLLYHEVAIPDALRCYEDHGIWIDLVELQNIIDSCLAQQRLHMVTPQPRSYIACSHRC